MDENHSKYIKKDSGNAGQCAKSRSKNNCHHKRKYHGQEERECDVNNKSNVQFQNVESKNNL